MVEYSMDDFVVSNTTRFVFDYKKLVEDTSGWYDMTLKFRGQNIMYDINCIDLHQDKGLCFYSDPDTKEDFFKYDPNVTSIRMCAVAEFESFDKGTFRLEHTDNNGVILNDYLTTVIDKKFDKWSTKIHVGDLIWFRTRYYVDDNHERVIDITSVGFVTRYDETMMTIAYRYIDNTVSPEHVRVKTIDLYPNRLRMFDWYIIDENNRKEVTK